MLCVHVHHDARCFQGSCMCGYCVCSYCVCTACCSRREPWVPLHFAARPVTGHCTAVVRVLYAMQNGFAGQLHAQLLRVHSLLSKVSAMPCVPCRGCHFRAHHHFSALLLCVLCMLFAGQLHAQLLRVHSLLSKVSAMGPLVSLVKAHHIREEFLRTNRDLLDMFGILARGEQLLVGPSASS